MNILSHYQNYFKTVIATTPKLKKQAYKLRYQVYYEEHKMVSANNICGELETDIWDQNSIQCLLFYKPRNKAIGTIRIIPLATSITDSLPIEQSYPKPFDFNSTPISHLHQGRTGEVSRMAILSSFRCWPTDCMHSIESDKLVPVSREKRLIFYFIPMVLAFSANILIEKKKLDYVVSLMEPVLARLLLRFGIKLKQIGEPIDYYGLRAPFLIFTQETYSNLPLVYKELYNVIAEELSMNTDPAEVREKARAT